MTLVGLPRVDDHSEVSILLPDEKDPDQRPDSQAKGQQASVSQCLEESNTELPVTAEGNVPVGSDEALICMNVGKLFVAEADELRVHEDRSHMLGGRCSNVSRPDWPVRRQEAKPVPLKSSHRAGPR